MVQTGPCPFDRALAQMSVLVPPGRAFRDGSNQRDWKRTSRNEESDRVERSSNDDKTALIRRGQRRIAYQTIWTQARQGVVEVYVDGGQRMVRMGEKHPSFSGANHAR